MIAMAHSVPRVTLTLNISTIGKALIFRSVKVPIGILPYVHSLPPLSLFSNKFYNFLNIDGPHANVVTIVVSILDKSKVWWLVCLAELQTFTSENEKLTAIQLKFG